MDLKDFNCHLRYKQVEKTSLFSKGWLYQLAANPEQCKSSAEDYKKEREKLFIRRFETLNDGINREW